MKTNTQFHGNIPPHLIGKHLREIVKTETSHFKILTGYGSTSGQSLSKNAAISSLSKMVKEGLIECFLPGEAKTKLYPSTSIITQMKFQFESVIKTDVDYGNEGIIFIFIHKAKK